MAVLVTGANGFIGKHVVNELYKLKYDVIGVVRSQVKADSLAEQFGYNPRFTIEVVPDITALDAFDSVFHKHGQNIDTVVHCASPLPTKGTDYEKTHIIPAVNGTKNLLEAIKTYGPQTVSKVVITSSVVAVINPEKRSDPDYVYSEDYWCPLKKEDIQGVPHIAYMVSKKCAEWTAWEFVRENRGLIKFGLTTLLPTYVFGPQVFEEDVVDGLNFSNEQVGALIHSLPGKELKPNMHASFIDVRDVAKAHVLAFQKEEATGQRLLITAGKYTSQDIVNILNDKFPQLKGKIAEGPHPGKFNRESTTPGHYRAEELLGIRYRSLEQSIYDTAAQVLKVENKL